MQKIKEKVVSVTQKGQATLPKEMRERYGIHKRALAIETPRGILLKSLPSVEKEMGSLKELFPEKTAKDLIAEARRADKKKDRTLEGML